MKSIGNFVVLFVVSVFATNMCLASGLDFWPIIGINVLIGGLLGIILK